jgi:hypothetical protein
MTGNWAYRQGCGDQEHFLAYSATNAAQARTDFTKYGTGVGYGAYWFMGGPGVDPHYKGTAAEASAWGAAQAARTLADIANGGGISDAQIPDTYEWTYEPETTQYSSAYPYGWCLDHGVGPCAQFFGGQTSASRYALM